MAPVEKGRAWGEAQPLPSDAVIVASDSAARAALEQARREHRPFPTLGLVGGDLCRTLGGVGDEARLRSTDAMTFRIDVGETLLDGRLHLFVSHLVAHTPLWGRSWLAMNAQWRGAWILGPRAHPGDGLLDVYDARLSVAARAAVHSRVRHGAHLPHPGIREERTPATQITLERPMAVALDGERLARARNISVRVMPDAVSVVV